MVRRKVDLVAGADRRGPCESPREQEKIGKHLGVIPFKIGMEFGVVSICGKSHKIVMNYYTRNSQSCTHAA